MNFFVRHPTTPNKRQRTQRGAARAVSYMSDTSCVTAVSYLTLCTRVHDQNCIEYRVGNISFLPWKTLQDSAPEDRGEARCAAYFYGISLHV